jgi:hypothetical protein
MSFSSQDIQQVWQKGQITANNDPNVWRKDDCGAWINRSHYGNRNSVYGWEIDHITPGGTDHISNLRPLQWQNNVSKSDGRLKCVVHSVGTANQTIG